MEFTSVVERFTTTLEVVKMFEPVLDSISKLLWKLVTLASDGGEEHGILYTVVCVVLLPEIFVVI